MVKLAPVAVPAQLTVPAQNPGDPTQSFEAALAAAGEIDLQSRPETLEFGALGMLGRHGAVSGAEAQPDTAVAAVAAAPVSPAGPQPVALPPALPGAVPADPARPAATLGTLLQSVPAPRLGRTQLEPHTQPTIGEQPSARLRFSSGSPSERTSGASRLRPAESARPAADPVRVNVADTSAGLQIALVAPGLAGEERQRLRNRLADVAAELGLHLADFTLNCHTVDAPGVGAFGGSHGRIRR